jgi:hypothetical protein
MWEASAMFAGPCLQYIMIADSAPKDLQLLLLGANLERDLLQLLQQRQPLCLRVGHQAGRVCSYLRAPIT